MSADLYTWCREHGVYVNQPDYYFLAGVNKTAMGYREDNWSLPRAQQLIGIIGLVHERVEVARDSKQLERFVEASLG